MLCRFTAYVAVDSRVVADGGLHRVMQPVEAPAGWDADLVLGAAPPSPSATRTARALMAEPMPSASVGAAAAMPSQPAPPAKASSGRTVKLRNVIAAAVASALLIGGGWAWSLNREGSSSPMSDGVVAGKIPASGDEGAVTRMRAGVPENSVSVPQAPAPPP